MFTMLAVQLNENADNLCSDIHGLKAKKGQEFDD